MSAYPPMKINGKWYEHHEIVRRDDCGPYDDAGIERARAFLIKHGEYVSIGAINLYRLLMTIDALRERVRLYESPSPEAMERARVALARSVGCCIGEESVRAVTEALGGRLAGGV